MATRAAAQEQEDLQEVQRHEDAEQASLQREDQRVELFDPGPGSRATSPMRAIQRDERRQQDQENAEAIDADVIGGANRRYQFAPLGELPGLAERLVAEPERQRHQGNAAAANPLAIHLIAAVSRPLPTSSSSAPASGVNRISERK